MGQYLLPSISSVHRVSTTIMVCLSLYCVYVYKCICVYVYIYVYLLNRDKYPLSRARSIHKKNTTFRGFTKSYHHIISTHISHTPHPRPLCFGSSLDIAEKFQVHK